jgi:hypothetical protein
MDAGVQELPVPMIMYHKNDAIGSLVSRKATGEREVVLITEEQMRFSRSMHRHPRRRATSVTAVVPVSLARPVAAAAVGTRNSFFLDYGREKLDPADRRGSPDLGHADDSLLSPP